MSTIILFWYLLCHEGECTRQPFEVTREAAAITACESSASKELGSSDMYAKNPNSSASGLFQFIDSTYKWKTGRINARGDTPQNQYAAFLSLWNEGKGWGHWRESQGCWGQWIQINQDGVAEWR